MQVKTITVNGAGILTARQGIQEKGNLTVSTGNIFGPEYEVSISKEGKALSERQTAKAEKDIQDTQNTKEERRMLSQQEEPSKLKAILTDIFEDCGLTGDRLRDRVDALYNKKMEAAKGGLKVPSDTVTEEKMAEVTNLIEEVKKINYTDIEIDPAKAQDLMQAVQEYKIPNNGMGEFGHAD